MCSEKELGFVHKPGSVNRGTKQGELQNPVPANQQTGEGGRGGDKGDEYTEYSICINVLHTTPSYLFKIKQIFNSRNV